MVKFSDQLAAQRDEVVRWAADAPSPRTVRCEFSQHRTLAHLRASQEQWRFAAERFMERNGASVTILHPWRHFDREGFETVPWDIHMGRFLEDRAWWLKLGETGTVETWLYGGKLNRNPRTVGQLIEALAEHEAHHIHLLRSRGNELIAQAEAQNSGQN